MAEDVVIIGACLAGMSTAGELRSLGFDGTITLIGEESRPPYDRPPLSKQVLTDGWGAERLHLPGHDALADLDIAARPDFTAVAADLAGGVVALHDGAEVPFDHLVAATGASPRPFPACSAQQPPRTLRTVEDAHRLGERLRPGKRVVIIGAGFLGTETAWSARALGCEVTLVGTDPAPLPGLGAEVGGVLSCVLAEAGVTLRTATGVTDLRDGEDGVQHVLLTDGTTLRADAVVAAIGADPRVEWLAGNGLDLSDGVLCDAAGRAAPGVYAAGDVARWWHSGLGRHIRVEHRMNAGAQGRSVARTILGAQGGSTPVPFFWSDQGPNKLAVHGHITAGARFELGSGTLVDGGFAGAYYEDDRAVAVLSWNSPKEALRLRRALLT
ncbi:NAD(P)/FAD-dependent oxidoreductase [Salinifilum ghardaiensis]